MDSTNVMLNAQITHPVCYVLLALGFAVSIRIVLGVLKSYEIVSQRKSLHFGTVFGRMLIGLGAEKSKSEHVSSGSEPEVNSQLDYGEGKGDYLAPLVVGLLELITLPVLMRSGYWVYSGAG